MSFPNETYAGRRGRSYSDGHGLIDPKTSSHHTPSPTPLDIAMMDTKIIDYASAPSNETTPGKKKKHHSRRHHHHHHGNRPRSKSLELHRHHSTPVHKKKYPNHHHKHIHRTSSHDRGAFPSPTKLKGKMWIRVATETPPFVPALASSMAPSPRLVDGGVFNDDANTPSLNHVLVSQVSKGGSSPSPASFDDDVLLYTPPNPYLDMRKRRIHRPANIAFGQNGKPIKPKHPFDLYNLNATAL